ncbi:MAG TPA: hypothetical protein VMV29_22730 [Ktedonobacterales bacterium]|nr:hypothetical protein [Ktedonobacterales bacterium]
MTIDRIRYEVRLLRVWALVFPPLIFIGMTLLAVGIALFTAHVDHHTRAQLMTASLEMLAPLGAAIIVASLTVSDPAMELRLTLPQPYGLTALLRAGLVVGWSGVVALVAGVFIYHWRFWRIPQQLDFRGVAGQFLALQLTWLAPLLCLSALGFCLAALLRNGAISGAILGVAWLIESLGYGYFLAHAWLHPLFLFPTTLAPQITFWTVSRLELIGIALAFTFVGWLLLRDSERLIGAADAASE